MKLAMLPDYYFPHLGGMEIWTQQISRHLVRRGHEVTIYAYKTSTCRRSERRGGLTVKRVGPFWVDRTHSYLVRGASLGIGLPPHLLVEKYDAYLPTYSPLLLCKMLKRRPVIPIWHGYYGLSYTLKAKGGMKGFTRYMIEQTALAQKVDALITVSHRLKELMIRNNQTLNSDKVYVVQGGVDLREIDSVEVERLKDQICFVGRFEYEKCPHHVIEAFSMICDDFPHLKLVMVGGGSMMHNLKSMVAQQPKLRDRVEFTGYLFGRDKIRVLKGSILLVRPSIMDAWPLTTLEALACNTPFVAYDIPPIREQIKETKGGLAVKKGDVEELANAIKGLVEETHLTRTLASLGRENVERKFTWDRSAEKLEEVIKSV